MVTFSGGVVDKMVSLDGFTEKMELLDQHNSDLVRDKVQQITKVTRHES